MVQWFRREDAPDPPLLDEAFLARLGKHIGMAVMRELVADGLLELSDRLDTLDRHAGRGEIAEIATLCHEIAGAAGHLGLTRISLAAVEAVRRCRGGTDEPAADIVAGILAAGPPSIEAADRYCRTADPAEPTPPAVETAQD